MNTAASAWAVFVPVRDRVWPWRPAGSCFHCAFAQHFRTPPKPEFQYQSGDIRVSIPSADEPRVKTFGPESLKAAAKYLEAGALSWVRGRGPA